eukprot:scaffold292625_cov18-Tisochrysis_lutea.AAC.1
MFHLYLSPSQRSISPCHRSLISEGKAGISKQSPGKRSCRPSCSSLVVHFLFMQGQGQQPGKKRCRPLCDAFLLAQYLIMQGQSLQPGYQGLQAFLWFPHSPLTLRARARLASANT